MAKQAKVKPTYLKGKKPITIGLHDVMKLMRVIDKHGHADKFEKAAKRKKAFMSVHPDTVNFVKDFVVKSGMHDHPIGRHVVKARDNQGAPALAKKMGAVAKAQKDCEFDCCF
jgi:hypothetical protein